MLLEPSDPAKLVPLAETEPSDETVPPDETTLPAVTPPAFADVLTEDDPLTDD